MAQVGEAIIKLTFDEKSARSKLDDLGRHTKDVGSKVISGFSKIVKVGTLVNK